MNVTSGELNGGSSTADAAAAPPLDKIAENQPAPAPEAASETLATEASAATSAPSKKESVANDPAAPILPAADPTADSDSTLSVADGEAAVEPTKNAPKDLISEAAPDPKPAENKIAPKDPIADDVAAVAPTENASKDSTSEAVPVVVSDEKKSDGQESTEKPQTVDTPKVSDSDADLISASLAPVSDPFADNIFDPEEASFVILADSETEKKDVNESHAMVEVQNTATPSESKDAQMEKALLKDSPSSPATRAQKKAEENVASKDSPSSPATRAQKKKGTATSSKGTNDSNGKAKETPGSSGKKKTSTSATPKTKKRKTIPVPSAREFHPAPGSSLTGFIQNKVKNLLTAVIAGRKAKNFWREQVAQEPFLKGWIMHFHLRPCKRHVDKYWFTPSGKRFRSGVEVNRYLDFLETHDKNEDAAHKFAKEGKLSTKKMKKVSRAEVVTSKQKEPPKKKAMKVKHSKKNGDVVSITNAVASASSVARKSKKKSSSRNRDSSGGKKTKKMSNQGNKSPESGYRRSAGAKARQQIRLKKIESGAKAMKAAYTNSTGSVASLIAEPKETSNATKKQPKKAAKKSMRAISMTTKDGIPQIAESK